MVNSSVLYQEIATLKEQLHQATVQAEATKRRFAHTESKLVDTETKLKTAITQKEQAEKKAAYYETEYERLIQAIKHAQREKFGSTSERFIEDTTQLLLFDPDQNQPQEVDGTKNDTIEEITYTRKKTTGARTPDSSKIPVREVIIPANEADRRCTCGRQKELIRYDEKSKLHYQPAVFEIVIEKREVWACRNGCSGSVVTAPSPKVVLPKCRATEELLAYIAISKVLDRQPLYHLEKKIERQYYWKIPRQTMARWMIMLSDALQPLINLMKDELLTYDIAACDATSLQVLNEPERSPTKKSYAYCIRGGPPGRSVTLFEYNAYNQKDYLVETFEDFKGFIHTDADSVYDEVAKKSGITLSLCHVHARRKFEQIYKANKKKDGLAKHAMKVYQELYKIEREATLENMSAQERHPLRLKRSKPLLDDFKEWLDHHARLVLPKSPIGKAISYARNNWDGLLVYLLDGRLRPDNNETENEIRPFVVARKNFMFACTMAGADALGVHFSLVLTAKHHGLDPYRYYVAILKAIPHCKTFLDYEALLPWNIRL